ncbi:MAG: hypothetical protein ABI375_00410 [Rudaea sp.]
MRSIHRARFEALAAYCRVGPAMGLIEEHSWYESDDGQLLGLVLRDVTDGDYQAAFLARDRVERFRWIHGTDFFDTPGGAIAALNEQAPGFLARLENERGQGDEPARVVDFFTLKVPPDRLHPHFAILREGEGYSPARELIRAMMRWHDDIDGNYVEQLQSTAFDARLLELYVFALLVENGFLVRHEGAAPDFLANNGHGEIAIEVTTANPTVDRQGQIVPEPEPATPEETTAYLKEYIPIKFGGPLTAKLLRRYWELAHVAGKPLLFTVQDFHAPQSMTRARTGLGIYLYGYDHDWHHDSRDHLIIEPRRVTEHRWGDKIIPSGFFQQEGAEHVSAVLFNNSATLPKFNRMGYMAGFGSRRVRMVRTGTALNPDPNAAEPFRFSMVLNEDYQETWSEGLDVFHNPRAVHPLDPRHFPMAMHHQLQPDGRVLSSRLIEDFHPLASITSILVPPDDAAAG